MADNVAITAGSGTTIATDDVSGVQFQKVKLVDGTADSSAVITGDTANGLDVDVTRLPALAAGTNNIGDVDVLTLPALATGTNQIGEVGITDTYAPVGAHSSGADISSATTLTKEAGANSILIQALTQNVRFTLDGTAP